MRTLLTPESTGAGTGSRRPPSLPGESVWLVGLPLAAAVTLAQVHLLDPTWSDDAYRVSMVVAVLVAWAGVVRIPAYRFSAACVAAGFTLVALGDLFSDVLARLGLSVAGVAGENVLYLAAYPAMWLGLQRLLPRGGRRTRVVWLDGVIDALAVFAAMAYVEWELAVAVLGHDGFALSSHTVWVLFPVLDAALIATAVRIWASRRRGNAGVVLVAVALFLWLVADLGFLLGGDDSAAGLAWVNAGWLMAGACIALGIWSRPRQVLPTTGAAGRPLTAARIGLALVPALVPGIVGSVAPVLGGHGHPRAGLLVTAVLIVLAFARAVRLLHDQVELRASLRSQARYFSALAANSSDAVVVVDRGGALTHESRDLARLLGQEGAIPAGTELLDVAVPTDRNEARILFGRVLRSPGQALAGEFRTAPADGRDRWFAVRVANQLEDPDVAGVVVTLQEVTDRMLAQQEIAHNALHDGLTGLANRALFHDRIEQALHRARRSNAWPVVLYVDLDRFKSVNDRHGHASGDELLREAAARFLTAVRTGDTVARLGGDEFAILLEGGRPGDEAEAVAERLLATLTAPFFLDGQRLRVLASVGMAVADAGSTVSAVVRDADIAMYAAKADGKARVCVFDAAMRSAAIERARLENDLDEAIERGQFRVAYQPVIDLATRRFAGFEALLRWDHPVLGPVPPGEFVEIAESAGRMQDLGRWVLREACGTAARWQRAHPAAEPLTMAVNVSGSQLGGDQFLAVVAEVLADSGLRPGSLVLGLTETALVHDPVQAAAHLRSLRELGVRLAIDDFGTGYSSLSYLRQFPVDILKIDRTFVAMITEQQEVPAIVRGLIELARTLRLELVAEGVETETQHERLRAERCDLAQGYLYARPLDADEAELQIVSLARAAAGSS